VSDRCVLEEAEVDDDEADAIMEMSGELTDEEICSAE